MEPNLKSLKKTARLAGLLYLLWVITGILGLMYLPSKFMVRGDAAATANNILANEFLFKMWIVNNLMAATICVFMLFTLYRLFKHVNEGQAKLMFYLFFVTVPVSFVMEALQISSLMVLKGEVLKSFELIQRQDLARFFLKINDYGNIVMELFWGLWLFPFGLLVYQSRFIPRILGIFLILNGIAYVIHCFAHLLFPDYQNLVAQIATPFWILGEISVTLWLLIKGVKEDISPELSDAG